MPKGYEMKEYNPESFLGSGYKRFDLKYIYDHLRNIGLSAALCVSGKEITKISEDHILSEFMIKAEYIGNIMMALSALLLLINFIQFIYVATSKGTHLVKSFSALISFPVYVLTYSLFYSYVFVK